MQKAIFIDRDGVINNDTGHYYIYKPENFVLNDGVIDFLKRTCGQGYITVIISNQGGISKGLYNKKDVDDLHQILHSKLSESGITITEIYFCPHHPDVERCLCRKPDSLMIEKAIARFDIDVTKSFFIGDREKDVQAAKKAGVKSIKITPNTNLLNYYHFIKP